MHHNGRSAFRGQGGGMWCCICHGDLNSTEAVSVPRGSGMTGLVRQRRGWAHKACASRREVVQ